MSIYKRDLYCPVFPKAVQLKKKPKKKGKQAEIPKVGMCCWDSEHWALLKVCLLCVYTLGLCESGGLFENHLTSIVDASHLYLGWM